MIWSRLKNYSSWVWAATGLLAIGMLAACSGTPTRAPEPQIQITPVESTTPTAPPSTERPTRPAADPADAFASAVRAAGRGRATTARTGFEALLGDTEFGARAAYNLGVMAQSEGAVTEAQRYYERALDSDPTMGNALTALIRTKIGVGDVDGANMAYQRALSRSENAPAIRAAGLLLNLHRGNYEAVIREARAILIQDESNIDAHYALAEAYHGLDQAELARLVLDEAIRREPDRADLYLLQARIQMAQGSDVAAIQSLRSAIDADPNFVEAHNNLGVLLHRARNEQEAISHLSLAIELRPDFAEAFLNLSNAYKGNGQLVESEQAIRRALEARPSFAQAYFNLGLLYLDTEFPGMSRVQRLESAIENLNRYRNEMRSALPRDDPTEEYINEALAALEAERQLESSGGAATDPGDGAEWDDESLEDDQFEDDELEDDGFEDEEWDDEEWE